MRPNTLQTLICSALLGWTAASHAQDEVTIFGASPAHVPSADEAAMSACFAAFIKELMPASNPQVHAIVRPGDQVFNTSSNAERMDVSMKANARRNGKLLAVARCTVTRSAKVEALHTQWQQSVALAGLTLRDISVRSTSRQ